jgi:hypothetical protein
LEKGNVILEKEMREKEVGKRQKLVKGVLDEAINILTGGGGEGIIPNFSIWQ